MAKESLLDLAIVVLLYLDSFFRNSAIFTYYPKQFFKCTARAGLATIC